MKTKILTQKSEILEFCKNHGIQIMMNFINTDGSFVASGDVNLANQNLTSMPVKIIGCLGNFDVSNNKFKILENMPKFINGDFNCNSNKLTSLSGLPRYILGDCDVRGNEVEFTPEMVKEVSFVCREVFTDREARLMEIYRFFSTREEIEEFCEANNIQNYKINDDLTVDVMGDVNLRGKNLYVLPFRFRDVQGNFDVSENHLFNLINSPRAVGKSFFCSHNNLRDMAFMPQAIGEALDCSHNSIESFDFWLHSISTHFNCSYNQLSSLFNCPSVINGSFDCSHNNLKDLNHAPTIVKEHFICTNNYELKSIEGSPSLVKEDYHLYNNGTKFSVEQIREVCAIWGRVFTDFE